MQRLGTFLDTRFTAFVEWLTPRASDGVGCGVPILSIIAVLLVPAWMHWGPAWYPFIEIALLGISFPLVLAWLVRLRREGQQRDLLNWTSDLRRLDAEEFEWLAAELYRREGWSVEHTGSQHHGDGNIDLKLAREGQRVIVQCKRWTAKHVGPDEVQRFAGTHPLRGDVTGRVFLTLSEFTQAARTAASAAQVDLVDGRDLAMRIQVARRAEPCPTCSTPMVLDRSMHGWWLRCPRYEAGCAGKKDLSRDPGRAVDILLAQFDV